MEENQPDNDKIKSVIDKQNVIIDDQRKMMKEQQKQIDELRKLKDQLDSGRAITNKVCDDCFLRLLNNLIINASGIDLNFARLLFAFSATVSITQAKA